MVFRPHIGSTFADTWYRISGSRPRLSPHASITPHRARGETRYVVEEPAGGKFFHLTESAHHFAGFLDGRRSVHDAWESCNAQLGDDAPTQREIVDLLANLQLNGFLLGDQPIETDMLSERRAMFRKTQLRARTGNYLFYHIPLINPEPILERTAHLLRPLYTRVGAAIWAVLVLSAIGVVLANLGRMGSDLNSVLAPGNLFLLWLTLIVVRGVHESGHAMACKAVGARCTEIGLMLVAVILPLPYCDATSSWKLPERSKRVLVSLGGLLAEGVLASAAVFFWATSEPGPIRTISFNVMLVSGVSSVIFNMNPLLRYDGYYILSDVADAPNLAQRARSVWIYLVERFAFGVPASQPPHIRDGQELGLLVVYQALAFPYRLFVLSAIVMLVSTQYLTVGVMLAVLFICMWLVYPVLKALWYLGTSPKLVARRARAFGVSTALVVVLVTAFGIVPWPTAEFASGAIEPERREVVRPSEDGFVGRVLVSAGERVDEGDVLLVLESPALEADWAAARARLAGERARLDRAIAQDPVEALVAEASVEAARREVERLDARLESLIVRAPIVGVVSAPGGLSLDPRSLEGVYLERGSPLLELVSDRLVVRAQIPDHEHGRVFGADGGPRRTSVRVRGSAGNERAGSILRVVEAGNRSADQPALTALAGGSILLDPQDPEKFLHPHFRVDIEVEDMQGVVPGVRAEVRFELDGEPPLSRVFRAARRYLDGRFAG